MPFFFRRFSAANDTTAFIRWDIKDATRHTGDDKLALVAWNGVKIGDYSQGANDFFPIMEISKGNASGAVDIKAEPRLDLPNHPGKGLALYVTGNMNNRGEGVEFRTNNGNEGLGFTKNTIYTTANNASMHFEVTDDGNFTFRTRGRERMFINSVGKVGIIDSLAIGGSLIMGSKIYWDWPGRSITQVTTAPNNSYIQFLNSDINSGNNDGGFRFASFKDNQPILRIRNNFVGIGTDDPEAPLNVKMIKGTGVNYDHDISNNLSHEFGWVGKSRKTHVHNNYIRFFTTCSILADGDIVTKSVLISTATKAYSDIRLKKDIRPSSSAEDLATLKNIAIVNYKMIDTIANDESYKKVIAQQVQKVYPLAVSITSKTLPDVFQNAASVSRQTDSSYLITVSKPEDLKAGNRLELKCNPANDVTVTVVKTIDEKSFIVTSAIALSAQTNVFVYGRPADDVLAVDYDAISMLNVSATQQLAKTIDELQNEVEQLKKQNSRDAQQTQIETLKKQNADQAAIISTMLARLSKLEDNKNLPPVIIASVQQ